ncbi:MAG: signal peptidase II [Ignavibacteriales bacterium]|nr:signal peptidase II [Ignavibacteriales bacterium]
MTGSRRALIIFLVMITCVGCDQAAKTYATRTLANRQPIGIFGEMFRLQYTENTGAMMGVGGDLPESTRFWLFVVFNSCALLAILAYTILGKSLRTADIFSFSLILGGGAGNLIDRLFKGGVVIDFMILTLGSLKTAIFNIADAAVISGLLLLAISNLPWFARRLEDGSKS